MLPTARALQNHPRSYREKPLYSTCFERRCQALEKDCTRAVHDRALSHVCAAADSAFSTILLRPLKQQGVIANEGTCCLQVCHGPAGCRPRGAVVGRVSADAGDQQLMADRDAGGPGRPAIQQPKHQHHRVGGSGHVEGKVAPRLAGCETVGRGCRRVRVEAAGDAFDGSTIVGDRGRHVWLCGTRGVCRVEQPTAVGNY